MSVAIAIVNYRTAGLCIDCLKSLEPERHRVDGLHVYLVDGGSGDDSAQVLAAAIEEMQWQDWVTLMPLAENRGFAYGNNAAIRAAMTRETPPDFVHLLNPDTYIRPGAVAELVAFLKQHPSVGIAGSRLENPDASPRRAAFAFPCIRNEMDRGLRWRPYTALIGSVALSPPPHEQPARMDWVSGASMMIKREVIQTVGLMDDAFFLYFEETDYMKRAHDAGYETWVVPASRVVHLVGQSTGVTGTKAVAKPVPAYWFESRNRYLVKHHGRVYAFFTGVSWLIGTALYRLRRAMTFKKHDDPPRVMRDFLKHNFIPRRVEGSS